MVLMTAICTALAGAGVLASLITERRRRLKLQFFLGIAVFSIVALTILESLTDRNLGLDFARPHAASLPGYSSPGRMTPNTTLVFLLIGYTLVLCGQSEKGLRSGPHIRAISLLIFLYGAIGLLAYYLKFQILFGLYPFLELVRIPPLVAVAAMLLACGFWSISYQKEAQAGAPEANGQELVGIFGVSGIVLLSTLAASGIISLALTQRSISHTVSDHLAQDARDDRTLIEQVIHDRCEQAAVVASEATPSVQPRAGSSGSRSTLREFGASLLDHDFSGIVFRGLHGEEFRVGKAIEDPPIRAPIRDVVDGEVIWKDGYYLSTRVPIRAQDGMWGEMLAQQPLEVLDRLTAETSERNGTARLVLCTRNFDTANCFPMRLDSAPFRIDLGDQSRRTNARIPMELALAGETGTGLMQDQNNGSVEASYLPVHNASLGLVLEMDSAEVNEPIRRYLENTIPLIVLLILVSLWIMEWRLKLLVDKLVDSREQVRRLALHDVLTGLPNRLLMEDRLQMAILAAHRNRSSVALAIVDVDNFKTVNDNFGHETGDLVLKEVANGLRNSIRASDTAARLGGDEFVLIVPDIKYPEATLLVAKKIQSIFSRPFIAGSYTSAISLSIGVAVYPAAGEDCQSLLRNADAAMYRAKKQGGNRFEVFGPTVDGSPPEDTGSAPIDRRLPRTTVTT
jgi:diguanylate cyclase (GGDEF)-like protein